MEMNAGVKPIKKEENKGRERQACDSKMKVESDGLSLTFCFSFFFSLLVSIFPFFLPRPGDSCGRKRMKGKETRKRKLETLGDSRLLLFIKLLLPSAVHILLEAIS
jgi:hypothetical protein